MKKIVLSISIIFIFLPAFAQVDCIPNVKIYEYKDKYPFYHYCRYCKSKIAKPELLCSHNFNQVFAGYSYDGRHWVDIGLSKDLYSCDPWKGGYLFSGSIITRLDKNIINGIKLSCFSDHLMGLQFYFLKYGFAFEGYTNYKSTDFILRPEIRISASDYIGFLTRVNFAYGYNLDIFHNNILPQRRHQVSIVIFLRTKGPIS